MPDSTSPQRDVRRDLRRRTIGLLIRRAREGAGRTVGQLAEVLLVKPATIKAYEAGTREPSLAELLAIGDWLSVPINLLLDETPSTLPIAKSQLNVPLRNHVLGATLKQVRLGKGQSLKIAASAVGITPSRLKAYELGEAMPITLLEALTAHFGLTMQHWFEADQSPISAAQQQQVAFAALPDDVRTFVTRADALPHLHIAMQLHTLPNNELRRVAEAFSAILREEFHQRKKTGKDPQIIEP